MTTALEQTRGSRKTSGGEDTHLHNRHKDLAGLLAHISSISSTLNEHQLLQVAARIADHSASDGIELCKQLRLNALQIRSVFFHDAFFLKHRELANEFFYLCEQAGLSEKYPDLDQASERFDQLANKTVIRPELTKIFSERAACDSQIQPLISEIDRVFAPFLKDRKFTSTNGGINEDLLKPVNWINKFREIYDGQYYKNDVFRILRRHITPEKTIKLKEDMADFPPLLSNSHIKVLFFLNNIDLDSPTLEKELFSARRLFSPLTATLEQEVATECLREALLASEEIEDFESFLNDTSDIYSLDHFKVSLVFDESIARFRLHTEPSPDDDQYRSLALLLLERYPFETSPCKQEKIAAYNLAATIRKEDEWSMLVDVNEKPLTPWLRCLCTTDMPGDSLWFIGIPSGSIQSVLFNLDPKDSELTPLQGEQIPEEWRVNAKIYQSIASWSRWIKWLNSVQDPSNLPDSIAQELNWINERAKQLADNTMLQIFNNFTKTHPELLLSSIAAKTDLSPVTEAYSLLHLVFPEIDKRNTWIEGLAKIKRLAALPFNKPAENAQLAELKHKQLKGGGLSELLDRKILLRSRSSLDSPLVHGIYTKCKPENMIWSQPGYSIHSSLTEPTKCVTLNVRASNLAEHCVLPAPLNSEFISERCIATYHDGRVEKISTKKLSSGPNALDFSSKNIKEINYSLIVGNNYSEIYDVDENQYRNFVRAHTAQHGKDLVEQIGNLSPELRDIINSLKQASPIERLCQIEEKLRSIFWYDINNDEVSDKKFGQPLAHKIAEMQIRLDKLKDRLFSSIPPEKLYAGVCTDFAEVGVALLRESGFAAGLVSAYIPEGSVVRKRDAHALCFVLWPAADGTAQPLLIDPTPQVSGFLSLFFGESLSINKNTLRNCVRKISFNETPQASSQEQNLAPLPAVETLDTLSNGALEEVVNSVLAHSIRRSELELCKQIVSSYLYTPYRFTNWSNNQSVEKLAGFLTSELERSKKYHSSKDSLDERLAGAHLLSLLEQSAHQIEERGLADSQIDGVHHLKKLFALVPQCFDGQGFQSVLLLLRYLGS